MDDFQELEQTVLVQNHPDLEDPHAALALRLFGKVTTETIEKARDFNLAQLYGPKEGA